MVNDVSDDSMSGQNLRQRIESARREAAELVGEAQEPAPPPHAVPGFEIIGEVGRGGMGVVYRALQVSTKRVVALKVMLAAWFASRSARKRFQREIELAARFQHPRIVRVLESGLTSTGHPYYAMDFIEGVHLDRWLAVARPDVQNTLRLLAEICEGVEHAHEKGVIHRDLKPANVLVDADGKPHILDFGLSKATDQARANDTLSTTVSSPGQVMGTLRYLSPEQAAGQPVEVDERTDVYALGVMLFEALTGALPFRVSGNPSDVIRHIQQDWPARPSSLSGRVGRELETIILKAIEKERTRRYQSVTQLREDINRYLDSEPILARPPTNIYVLRKKLAKHRPGIFIAAAMLALIGIVATGSIWWKERALAQEHDRAYSDARRSVLAAQRLLDLGRAQEASEMALALLASHPDMPGACLVWAKARFQLAQHSGDEGLRDIAIVTLQGRLNSDTSSWAFRALLAELYDATGIPSAGQLRESAERDAPNTANAWYLRSLATLDPDRTVRCAERAVNIEHGHYLAWQRLARLYLLNEDFDKAINAARTLIDIGEDRRCWMMFQGEVLLRQGRYAEAAEKFTQAAGPLPDQAVPYRARGAAFLCQEKYAEAIQDYSEAFIDEKGDEAWARYARATPLWIVGRLEEAIDDYRAVRELRGQVSCADARLYLVLQDQAGRLDAEGQSTNAELARAEASVVLAKGCQNAIRDSRLCEMLKCLARQITPERLVALADPDDSEDVCESLYYAGEACLLDGRTDQAREFFFRCMETDLMLDPDSLQTDAMNEFHLARWRLRQLRESSNETPHPAQSRRRARSRSHSSCADRYTSKTDTSVG